MLDYCEGSFEPGPVPNATLKASKISRNVTHCSNRTSSFEFDPGAALQRTLDETNTGVTLSDLGWPADLDKGIRALRDSMRATFVLYCIGVSFAFLALVAFVIWMFGPSAGGDRGRPFACTVLSFLSFFTLGIASAIATAVAVKGNNVIDKYGKAIGVEAERGNRYLALTWVATALMFVATLFGCAGMCFGRRKHRVRQYGEK
jgi:SUR7/PalI family